MGRNAVLEAQLTQERKNRFFTHQVTKMGNCLQGLSGLCGGYEDGLGGQRVHQAHGVTYLRSLWSRQTFRTWKSFLARKTRGPRIAFLPLLKPK